MKRFIKLSNGKCDLRGLGTVCFLCFFVCVYACVCFQYIYKVTQLKIKIME